MRIRHETAGDQDRIALYLTRAEAEELRDSIGGLLGREAGGMPGDHEHISSADYQREITPIPSDDVEA